MLAERVQERMVPLCGTLQSSPRRGSVPCRRVLAIQRKERWAEPMDNIPDSDEFHLKVGVAVVVLRAQACGNRRHYQQPHDRHRRSRG